MMKRGDFTNQQTATNFTDKQLFQLNVRIPEKFFEIYNGTIFNPYPFRFQQLLHGVAPREMNFTRELPVPINNAMCRNPIFGCMANV